MVTFGLSHLAEQHRHKMIPGTESFALSLCTMFPDQTIELTFADQGLKSHLLH
jgi:hypothetical protein